MFRRTFFVLPAVLVCLLFAATARAHDEFPPWWRGLDGTTHQEWQFNDNDDPAAPDVVNNPYGTSIADITVGQIGSGWLDQLGGYGGQSGYWDLGGSDGSIVIDIDNRDEPLPYKEIWVQVTYWKDLHQAPDVDVPGAVFLYGDTAVIETVATGGTWLLDLTVWRMEPNPNHERIIITADPGLSIVDQIVVDTRCVPEPATMSLLVVSGLGLLLGRLRKKVS